MPAEGSGRGRAAAAGIGIPGGKRGSNVSKKWVYFFGNGQADGEAGMRELLGGKGANLAEMTRLGIPVPAGFTITTEACTYYYQNDGRWPEGLEEQVWEKMAKVEAIMGGRFGDPDDPLVAGRARRAA